jgi:hypothetical protein
VVKTVGEPYGAGEDLKFFVRSGPVFSAALLFH